MASSRWRSRKAPVMIGRSGPKTYFAASAFRRIDGRIILWYTGAVLGERNAAHALESRNK
jgi:hypothetical protein